MGTPGFFQAARIFFRQGIIHRACEGPRIDVNSSVKHFWGSSHSTLTSSLRKFANAFNEKLNVLGEVFAKQCHAIAVQRVRRSAQIINLYSTLYNEQSLEQIVKKFGHQFLRNSKGRPLYLLFGASLFSWNESKVTDEELNSCVDDMNHVTDLESQKLHIPDDSSKEPNNRNQDHYMDQWELVIDRENIKLWRRPIQDTYLYEYKVFGRFFDIPAKAFYSVQVDIEYRKQWDRLVIALETVDKDEQSGCEVLHWITHYPYPMYSRDYVYIRRHRIDYDKKAMVLISRAVDHPCRPESKKYVRVKTYSSQMVIKPHTSFDENGFDYILTYHDDPKAAFPSVAYNWMASTGVPDFVDKLHNAAKTLHERKAKRFSPQNETTDENISCYS
ncbi:stAR-related lipid transfer protein 7, mitochondrial-like [Tubulanus polymorphus]|uniref:stAR-related lipid transfer protein 7, mitochondrial-like n=1 Tax=Tubulanus polymorphus TaxID=672921 RepID=UPI003DA58C3D